MLGAPPRGLARGTGAASPGQAPCSAEGPPAGTSGPRPMARMRPPSQIRLGGRMVLAEGGAEGRAKAGLEAPSAPIAGLSALTRPARHVPGARDLGRPRVFP